MRTSLAAALLFLATTTQHALAQCPGWSAGFGRLGTDGLVLASASRSTNPAELVIGGEFTVAGSAGSPHVARWTGADFEPLGNGLAERVTSLAYFDDGNGEKLYAGVQRIGAATTGSRLSRWDEGVGWTGIDTGPSSGGVTALLVFDDGTGPALYVAGTFSMLDGQPFARIARWDGTSWSSVGAGFPTATLTCLAVHDDGNGPLLYAGGQFENPPSSATIGDVARWDGSAWTRLSPQLGVGRVRALASYTEPAGPALFVSGAFDPVDYLAFTNNIARWRGGVWSDVAGGVHANVNALAVVDTGSGPMLAAGGSIGTAGGQPARTVAYWNGSTWSSALVFSGSTNQVHTLTALPSIGGGAQRLFAGGTLYAIGASTFVSNVALLENGVWRPLGGGQAPDAAVKSVVEWEGAGGVGRALYAAGTFTKVGTTTLGRVARWSNGAWESIGDAQNSGSSLITAQLPGDTRPMLYLGGNFSSVGGVAANAIARFDGTSWSQVGGGLIANVLTLAAFDDGNGMQLYAGGNITTTGGVPMQNIARFDGVSWHACGTLPNFVQALCVHDDGTGPALYAAAGMLSVQRWDGVAWTSIPGGNEVRGLYALASFDSGGGPELFAGGDFTTGAPSPRVARWDGSTWLAAGAGFGNRVYSFGTFDDGSGQALFAGGVFTASGATPTRGLARWNGAAWEEFGGGVGGLTDVLAIGSARDSATGQRALCIGGRFQSVGTTSSGNIARWVPCASETFCAGDGLDPNVVPCPCANFGSPGHGCQNVQGLGGGRLEAQGVPSVAFDSLQLVTSSVPNVLTIYLQAEQPANGGAGAVFDDGVTCIGTPLLRLKNRVASGGISFYGAGQPNGELVSVKGQIPSSGATRYYQVWYRNSAPYCTPATSNRTNAVKLTWTP